MNFDYLNEGLLEQIEQAFKEIRENAYAEGYKQGRYDAEMDAIHTVPIPNKPTSTAASIAEKFFKEPQAKRDEIVEKAKRDVAEIIKRGRDDNNQGGDEGNETYRENFYVVKFVVNNEKRTVVALISLATGCGRTFDVKHKGIAKCAPDDCFNVHIGKAIAVRRALGLEVPTEYLNAPQPTEVRDYDKLRHFSGKILTVTPSYNYEHTHGTEECQKDAPVVSECVIIDDSRE